MDVNVKDYLEAVCKSQTSPMEVFMKIQQDPEHYCIIDVRVGPTEFRREKIVNAKEMPLSELGNDLATLPANKKIALYTWGSECTLAKHALIILGEAGFDAIEIGGGIAAWKNTNLPVEPVIM